MKILTQKTRMVYIILAFCLCIMYPAVGQTPDLPPLSGSAITAIKPTPEQDAIAEQQGQLDRTAAASLHVGRYDEAEAQAREVLSLGQDGLADELLAEALNAQNKDKEAMAAYRMIVVDQKNPHSRVLLPYALLLLKAGQWEQALAVSDHGLFDLNNNVLKKAVSQFTPTQPQPAALEAILHTAMGQIYDNKVDWSGDYRHERAIEEYEKALQLAPDSPITNYYYGYGWQELYPKERVQMLKTRPGLREAVKAALAKAAKMGTGEVQKAAAQELAGLK